MKKPILRSGTFRAEDLVVVGSVRQDVETNFTCLPMEKRADARRIADHFLAEKLGAEWDDLRALRIAQRATAGAN